jgi:hypothetical protein
MLIGIGVPSLAASKLISLSQLAPADRYKGIDRYYRPIASPLRFWLNRIREGGSRHEHQTPRKSSRQGERAHHGACTWPMQLARVLIATSPLGRLNV